MKSYLEKIPEIVKPFAVDIGFGEHAITDNRLVALALFCIADELAKFNHNIESFAGIVELKESLDEMNLSIRSIGADVGNTLEGIFVKDDKLPVKESIPVVLLADEEQWCPVCHESMLFKQAPPPNDPAFLMCSGCTALVLPKNS